MALSKGPSQEKPDTQDPFVTQWKTAMVSLHGDDPKVREALGKIDQMTAPVSIEADEQSS